MDETQSKILPEDLKIETLRKPDLGGQTVGMPQTGVKVTHLPSGLEATCWYARSQWKNKEIAIHMIEWGLTEL